MSGKTLNSVASFLTIFMGFSHFFVPILLPWNEHLYAMYPPLSWALYAMNFFFSFLLTWAGFLVYVSHKKQQLRSWIVGGVTIFWIVSALYLIIVPFPLPEVRWILPIYSLVAAVVHLAVLRWSGVNQRGRLVNQ